MSKGEPDQMNTVVRPDAGVLLLVTSHNRYALLGAAVFSFRVVTAFSARTGACRHRATSIHDGPWPGSVFLPTEAFCVSSPDRSRHSRWSFRWRHGPARTGSYSGPRWIEAGASPAADWFPARAAHSKSCSWPEHWFQPLERWLYQMPACWFPSFSHPSRSVCGSL